MRQNLYFFAQSDMFLPSIAFQWAVRDEAFTFTSVTTIGSVHIDLMSVVMMTPCADAGVSHTLVAIVCVIFSAVIFPGCGAEGLGRYEKQKVPLFYSQLGKQLSSTSPVWKNQLFR